MIPSFQPKNAAEVFANAAAVRKRIFSPQKRTVPRGMAGHGVPLGPEATAIELLRKKVTQADVRRQTGLSRRRVKALLLEAGITIDHQPPCERHKADIHRLFLRGLSCRCIAGRLGLCRNAISNLIKAQGWTR